MKVEQFVMAYGVEHDRLRSILPDGFSSLRPVLRVNAEIREDTTGYLEFNTAIEAGGKRGWLNIGCWDAAPFVRNGKSVRFKTDLLEISFTASGIAGGCPAEAANDGCYFLRRIPVLRPPESIAASKEFCDCEFAWSLVGGGAHGVSLGKTLPAVPVEVQNIYPKQAFTVENAARIPCEQVLGAYIVKFER